MHKLILTLIPLLFLTHVSNACDDTNYELAYKFRVAIDSQDTSTAESLLSKGACINGPKPIQHNGFLVPLLDVAYTGDLYMAKFLVEHGADVNKTENGYTGTPISALQVAAQRMRREELVEYLVEHGANLNIGDNQNDVYLSPLGGAVKNANERIFDYLISKGAKPVGNELVILPKSPLQASFVKKLIVAGASPNAKDSMHNTPLHVARDPFAIQKLIKNGAKLEAENAVGNTPIFGFVQFGLTNPQDEDCETARPFVEAGANLGHLNKKGQNVLLFWLSSGWIDAFPDQLWTTRECAIENLLKSNAAIDVNVSEVKTGLTPLMYAANWVAFPGRDSYKIRMSIISMLISKGANVNAKDSSGRSVISFARNDEIRDMLIKAGAK